MSTLRSVKAAVDWWKACGFRSQSRRQSRCRRTFVTVFLPRPWARGDKPPAIIFMLYHKSILCSFFLTLVCTSLVNAQRTEDIARKVGNPIAEAEEERKALRQ